MTKRPLIIVCGVPGAGKSTFAHRAVDRWGAVSFASENFADALGVAARTPAGVLTKQAMTHAYSAMGAAVTAALATNKLVVAVGAFRAEEQRRQFREIAGRAGAGVTVLRILCPSEAAAKRVHLRTASGERGPTENAIRQIEAELNRASGIDVVLTNDVSIEHFHRRADAMMEFLVWGSDREPPDAAAFVERFDELAASELALLRDLIGSARGVTITAEDLQRSRERIREVRDCLLLGAPKPVGRDVAAALQEILAKWLSAVDRLGM
jgi:predicted kinase